MSTTTQSTDGAGLENQKHINDIAIERLLGSGEYTRLPDIVEVGSAFKGNNLSDVLSNTYPSGSIIVMFDQTRFSRTDFFDALTKMREIVSSGLMIHFSTTGQTVGKELLEDFGQFVAIAASASASNTESRNRSNRATASYQKKVKSGDIVSVGHIPSWIRRVYDVSSNTPKHIGYELVEERIPVINKIFEMYTSGCGVTQIIKWLNAEIPTWDENDFRRKSSKKIWRESYISKMLVNPAIIGRRVFNIGKDNESVVDDYFPAVIPKHLWFKAQEVKVTRKRTASTTKYPANFLSGLTYCGYCGGRCTVLNTVDRTPKIRCTSFAKGEVECAGGSSQVSLLEKVIMEFCSDEVNYNLLFDDSKDVGLIKSEAMLIEHELAENNKKLEKLEDLYLDGDISKERYITRKGSFDSTLTDKKQRLSELRFEIELLENNTTDMKGEFIELLNEMKNGGIPNDKRLLLRDLLPKFIEKINIYRYGKECQVSKNITGEYVKDRKKLSYWFKFINGAEKSFSFDSDGFWYVNDTDIAGM